MIGELLIVKPTAAEAPALPLPPELFNWAVVAAVAASYHDCGGATRAL